MQASQTSLKDIADIMQAFATVIALLIGGIWSYMLFVKKRQRYPRASITHQISHRPMSNSKIILNVTTIISNTGDVLLSLVSGLTRVQQMLPLSTEILKSIDERKDPVPDGKTEIEWPLISERLSKWEKEEFEIEPGEKDQIYYDFIFDADIQTVSVYSYFKNVRKHERDIGWGLTTIYDLKDKHESPQREV